MSTTLEPGPHDVVEEDDERVLSPPDEFADGDWAERIERAKQAHKAGRELRRGKPLAFNERRVRSWRTHR